MSSIVAVVLCVDADVVCSKMHVGIGRHFQVDIKKGRSA